MKAPQSIVESIVKIAQEKRLIPMTNIEANISNKLLEVRIQLSIYKIMIKTNGINFSKARTSEIEILSTYFIITTN